MDQPIAVFISSVIRDDELKDERLIAKKAIEELSIAKPWLFEFSEASSDDVKTHYLNRVNESDIFVQILEKNITSPVIEEYNLAEQIGIPRLIFVKEANSRSQELEAYKSEINVTWKKFTTRDDLFNEIQKAVIAEVSKIVHKASNKKNLHRISFERHLFDKLSPTVHSFLTRHNILHEPKEYRAIHKYLREVHNEMEKDSRSYFPLRATNVPDTPLIHDPYQRALDQTITAKRIRQFIRLISGLSHGGDFASAQIAAISRRNKIVRNLTRKLIKTKEPMVLLGDPGTGKSMTLREVGKRLAHQEMKKVFPRIIVYIRMGDFSIEGVATKDDILQFVKSALPASIQIHFEQILLEHRVILLFDGLDEMNRENYGKQIEALSDFAGIHKDRIKALFSCRINEFSPNFAYRQLVLLPFVERQIVEYIRVNLRTPVKVEGEHFNASKLAKRLLSKRSPLDPRNPQALFLTCNYLLQKEKWPSTRAELLFFFFESTYEYFNNEAEKHAKPFAEKDKAFLVWGQFAYIISRRNRGSGISYGTVIQTLQDEHKQNGEDVQIALDAGLRCGFLVRDETKSEALIRFEHHRYEEFFTAYFITKVQPELDWPRLLDVPAWQETLLYLVGLRGGNVALKYLANSISEGMNGIVQGHKDKEKKLLSGRSSSGQTERYVSDRIELATGILKECSGALNEVELTLREPTESAVKHLAEHGNPITQVKMMLAANNLPTINMIEVLRHPLQSACNWVRTQAVTMVAGDRAHSKSVGSDLGYEIGYDLASGRFGSRVLTYLRTIWSSRSVRWLWCFILAAVSSFIGVFYFISYAVFFYAGFVTEQSPLNNPLLMLAYGAIVVGGTILINRYQPGFYWVGLVIGPIGIFMIANILYIGYQGYMLKALFKTFYHLLIMPLSIALAAAPGIFLPVIIYIIGSLPMRVTNKSSWSLLKIVVQSTGFGKVFTTGLRYAIMFFIFELLRFLWNTKLSGLKSILVEYGADRLTFLPFGSILNSILFIVLVLSVLTALFVFIVGTTKKSDYIFKWLQPLGSVMGAVLLFVLYGWVLRLIIWLSVSTPGKWVGYVLAGAVSIAIFVGIVFLFKKVLNSLSRKLPVFHKAKYAPEKWKTLIKGKDALDQSTIIARTTHVSLNVTPEAFLVILEEIEGDIKEEPALSEYWSRRNKIEQVLRQERTY